MARFRGWAFVAAGLAGCSARQIELPDGHLPPVPVAIDATAGPLDAAPKPVERLPPPKSEGPKTTRSPFRLPSGLPGGDAPAIEPPRFPPGATAEERREVIRKAYPELEPVSATFPGESAEGAALTLADLQEIAAKNSPVLRRAEAEAEVSYGNVIQAGLYPNPTVGYQADQVQPRLKVDPGSTGSGGGQQGGYINQLIKTAGKLSLARQVAAYDYINALVAVRRARVDVTAAVRRDYFALIVARKGLEVSKALADASDQVYRLQLGRLVAGEAAAYEPLQLYAQSFQARNAVAQSESNAKAAWRQLGASVGQPDLTPRPLAGEAAAPPPAFERTAVEEAARETHTDVLTARNTVAQAQTSLVYQERLRIPDIQTNQYHQYDNLAQAYQFGVQIGVTLPIYDRNQGHILAARARIGSSAQQVLATQNEAGSRVAEAFARYEADTRQTANFRDRIIPSLTQAYRAIVRRYEADGPDKVQFNDVVSAQESLVSALRNYLQALDGQWRAVADLAAAAQIDELYPAGK